MQLTDCEFIILAHIYDEIFMQIFKNGGSKYQLLDDAIEGLTNKGIINLIDDTPQLTFRGLFHYHVAKQLKCI